jgi:hypothetical protein
MAFTMEIRIGTGEHRLTANFRCPTSHRATSQALIGVCGNDVGLTAARSFGIPSDKRQDALLVIRGYPMPGILPEVVTSVGRMKTATYLPEALYLR